MPRLLPLLLCLAACDGTVSELGTRQAELPPEPEAPGQPRITTFECTPDSGPATFTTTCTVAVVHPDNRPLRCMLSVDDGRTPPLENADCASGLTQAVTFETPGPYSLTLLVRDDLGATVQAVRSVQVAPRPNKAPVVTTFSAAPLVGTAPLSTTLTWAVSDPDGDALSCSIDVGFDGSVEYPALDCAALSQAHTLATPGTAEVLFVVTDAKGLSAQSVLLLNARAPVGDLRISKVEWGQSVVTQAPRLVQGKSALLRIHVLADKAALADVTVEAEGFTAAGVSLGKLPLVGPATPPIAEVPADLKQQWTATVPPAWIEVGVELRLSVDPLDRLPETNETNNARIVKPLVGKGTVLQLTSVPVVHQGVTAGVPDLQPILTRLWPVKAVANQTRAPYTFGGTLLAGDTSGWGQLLQSIAALRQADGSGRNYYGFVKVGYGSGISGIGYIGQEASTGRDDSAATAAHELGHNLGRNHAPCGGAGGPDQGYPYAGGKIGTWGYDYVNRALLNPATFNDLMGYCQPEWVSDYNYKAVQTFLEAAPYVPPQPPAAYAPVVLLAGVIRGGEVTLRPVHRLVAAQSAPTDGPWTVTLHPAVGPAQVHAFTPLEAADADEAHFTLLVSDPGPLLAIEVRHANTVLARRLAIGGAAPAASLARVGPDTVRLTWDARRFASAEVAHLADDGARTTLAVWLDGGDRLIRTDGLAPGRFEVSLSDGVASARQLLSER